MIDARIPGPARATNNKEINEDNSNTLRIEDEDLTNNLEIMDINTLDTEPDIKLDIEELT